MNSWSLIDKQYFKCLKFTPRHEVQIMFFFAWKISKIDSQIATLLIHLLRNKRHENISRNKISRFETAQMLWGIFNGFFIHHRRYQPHLHGPINRGNVFVSFSKPQKKRGYFQLLIMWHNAAALQGQFVCCFTSFYCFSHENANYFGFIVIWSLEKCKLNLIWRNFF